MRKVLLLSVIFIFSLSVFSFEFFVSDLSGVKGDVGLASNFNSLKINIGAEVPFLKGTLNDFTYNAFAGIVFIEGKGGAKLSFKIGTFATKLYASIDSINLFQVGGMQRFWGGYLKAGLYLNPLSLYIGLEY
jgi:hypothetical protein